MADTAPQDWHWLRDPARVAATRAALWRLLGPRRWPAGGGVDQPIEGWRITDHPLPDAWAPSDPAPQVERWHLRLNDADPVPAWLMRPPTEVPLRGVVLYAHAHGGRFQMGADELLLGRPALQQPAYGPELAARGWASLAIDHWGFGDRQHQGSERALVKQALWQGSTLWGWRLHDALAARQWLSQQPEFDHLPIVALGLSMGSTLSLWSAALDEGPQRISACADLCCAAEYAPLLASGGFDGHAEYFFVPGLLREGFTLARIAALIAPGLHLSLAGTLDPLTPPAGLDALDRSLAEADRVLGCPGRWQAHREAVGHQETPAMRQRVLGWLDAVAACAACSSSRR